MTEIYTIYGGDMWREALNGIVTIIGTSSFKTLLRIAGTFSVLGTAGAFVSKRNPMEFVKWLAVFVGLTSGLLLPKTSVQIVDITDPAAVYEVDNVPAGLAVIAHLTTSVGYGTARLYDMALSRPDSVTYTKSGMLFGSEIVAQTTDFQTQNPALSQILPDYVENCVVGDILLNHKYTVNDLLNSQDPLSLITRNPSPLRGIYTSSGNSRVFETCQQAAGQIQTLVGQDSQPGSNTFSWLASRIYGSQVNGPVLLAQAMNDSYGYFYSGGLTAAQVMKNNITNSAIRSGIKGFAARSDDTANLVNLAAETSMTKQRLAWSTMSRMATRYLPFAQSLLMLILVCLFPLVIVLAATNHSIFGVTTIKYYIGGFLYFQMWPVMFAILNFAATFYLQTKTGGTPLVLSNYDQVALQHSDVANMAGYLSMSIPVLSFYLTKGAASVGSQVAGSVFSSMAFGSASQAGTTADGNWSFNNMSMDNVNQNKLDTNLVQRQGQQTWQAGNGSSQTLTSDGHHVFDSSGAISNLPVNLRLSQLASSGFQEQARNAEVQAQSSLDGYNHSVASGWSQLSQLSHQTGNSDSLTQGTDNSQTLNATKGASLMMNAVESYAKSHNVSQKQAYNQLMDISNQGSAGAGARAYVKFDTGDQLAGKLGKWATGLSAGGEANLNTDWRHTSGSSHGTQDSHDEGRDNRHDQSSQEARDFRQGMDMVTSSRITDSGNHTDNTSSGEMQQFGATLNDTKSQYHQYTDSDTRSREYSRMASLAENQSASLDANYNQEFVNWAEQKYGPDAQSTLTNVTSARAAAAEFVEERLKPEIMGDYQQGRADVQSGGTHDAFSGGTVRAGQGMVSDESSPVSVPQVRHERPPIQAHTGQGEQVIRRGSEQITGADGLNRGTMREDFERNQSALPGAAESFKGGGDISRKVAEQRSANGQKISNSSEEIEKNKTTVQTSSDILRNEHHGAVISQQIGRTEEDLKQTKPGFDHVESDAFKQKLKELREQQKKAS
jgi:conjugal transfer mating pair stabilization protein TraG